MEDREIARRAVTVIVVTGVAGSGKSMVGALLAGHLGWPYADGDDFHPAANVARMAAGQPLTDADRWPWLAAVGRWIDERRAAGESGVVSCSALRRRYRDLLRRGRPEVRLVHLDGDRDLIARRLAARHGHFFRTRLLDSQFADLEPPAPEENVLTVGVDGPPAGAVNRILTVLAPGARPLD
jgi:gluconokinase